MKLAPLSLLVLCLCWACDAPGTGTGSHAEPMVSSTRDESLPAKAKTSKTSAPACQPQEFVESIALSEASGATFLSEDSVLMIGDSGSKGAFVVLRASDGHVLREGRLPLDPAASDDLEGVSHMDGSVYALTSSGWMRKWSVAEDGFALEDKSYPLAPRDERGLVCSKALTTNCAKNYEGLCLLPSSPKDGQCAGFAAAKATGELICLTSDTTGKLTLDSTRVIQVAKARSLSGCDFDDQGRLWFGNNFFAASRIGYVDNWRSPAQAQITKVGSVGFGFPEAIAVGKEGLVIRASDTGGSPSLLSKYICR